MSEKYLIRKAMPGDLSALRTFLDEHWRREHIFVTNQEILDFQHLDAVTGHYNFILGIEKDTGSIHGVLGFIRLSQYDSANIAPDYLIWMAIWKVREDARGHNLGRNILAFLNEHEHPQIVSTVAASAMTLSMYRQLGYLVDTMQQYFILNPDLDEYQLAKIPKNFPRRLPPTKRGARRIEDLTRSELLAHTGDVFSNQAAVPVKTPDYVAGRYLDHPIYRYHLHKITEDGSILGILVTRDCGFQSSNAVRVVDFCGPDDALEGLEGEWIDLARRHQAEYVDFYCAGIRSEVISSSGFLLPQDHDGVIIPNYFEPFVQKTVPIDFMISIPPDQPYRILRGDSDQDRPNINPGDR